MRFKFSQLIGVVAIASLTCTFFDRPSVGAATFEEREIEQDRMIAIARPYGKNKYDLLVIEQIPGKKQCWSESGTKPIEPLLLKFDFTGHCSRSTDSNGYSIRVDGQDFGLDYLLRIEQRNGELLLVGTSRSKPNAPDVIIGRTYGIRPGFLKIVLSPGWQFSKRTYQGKVLGHVYFSGDRAAMNAPIDTSSTVATTTPQTLPPPSNRTNSRTRALRPDTNLPTRSNSRSPSTNREITFRARNSSPALPPASNTSTPRRLPSVFSSPPSSPKPTSLPTPPAIPSGETPTNTSESASRSPANIKPSSENTLSDVMGVEARPLPGGASVASANSPTDYRVLVEASDSGKQKQLKSLYPDAFETVYQGRSMWQIGKFNSWDNADKAVQGLRNVGLDGMVLE
jgi:hypothetical protein